MAAIYSGPLPTHGRFDYQAIHQRPTYRWPNGAGLAVYLGFNIEHFAFGEGLGAGIGPASQSRRCRSSHCAPATPHHITPSQGSSGT